MDGFRLTGFAPREAIAGDPFLRCTKLFADSWEEALERRPKTGYPMPGDGKVTLRDKHLAEYNGRFEEDMRRLLKGDEGMLNSLAFHSRRNPELRRGGTHQEKKDPGPEKAAALQWVPPAVFKPGNATSAGGRRIWEFPGGK